MTLNKSLLAAFIAVSTVALLAETSHARWFRGGSCGSSGGLRGTLPLSLGTRSSPIGSRSTGVPRLLEKISFVDIDGQLGGGLLDSDDVEEVGAVVDERLRVFGVSALRVIDASVMPTITSGNTNSPTLMIAEKGAAMVLEDAKR